MRRKFLAPRSLQRSSQPLNRHVGEADAYYCTTGTVSVPASTTGKFGETTHKSLNLLEVLVKEHVREPAQPTRKVSLRPPRPSLFPPISETDTLTHRGPRPCCT